MKRLKHFLVICFAVLGSFALNAQDIHFSQFYMSPLNLNPALTGVMNCNVRLVANYRNQWASVLKSNAFKTYSVSYDQRIPVGRYDYFGVGGSFWGIKPESLILQPYKEDYPFPIVKEWGETGNRRII